MNPPPDCPTPPRRPHWAITLSFFLLAALAAAPLVLRMMRPERESVEASRDDLAALTPAELHPYRLRLIPTLSRESLTESIQKLHFFDDAAWASSFVKEVHGPCLFSYDCRFIPALARVRKIVAEGPNQKSLVEPLLKQKLVDAVEGNVQDAIDLIKKEVNAPPVVSTSEWNFAKTIDGPVAKTIDGPAAAYLLSELRCFDALPLMARVFETREPLPLSRIFLFYAMHVMVLDHPRESLSAKAIQALDDYRKATAKLPPSLLASVPAWNVPLTDPTEWRVTIPGANIGSEQKPQVLLHYYSMDVSHYDDGNRLTAHPEVEEWFKKLRVFLRLAYPQYR